MAQTLFSIDELTRHLEALTALQLRLGRKELEWDAYWSQREAVIRAHELERTRRAQARAEEFLNALVILVGSRGVGFEEFDRAFERSDSVESNVALSTFDTPEARRSLYTILRALTEVPKTWARSAFVRFLRGVGKQAGAKYHGAGTFAVEYGWKERELTAICDVIMGRWEQPYAATLMSYRDPRDPDEQPNTVIDDDESVPFGATHVERDVDFLNRLCAMLEARGLGPVPAPASEKPKKPRKAKQFSSGDLIRERTLRDLPLPAHVRVPIKRFDEGTNQWLDDTIEHVVVSIGQDGHYAHYTVMKGSNRAYIEDRVFRGWRRKDWLEGATYLGPWTGELKQQVRPLGFQYRSTHDSI